MRNTKFNLIVMLVIILFSACAKEEVIPDVKEEDMTNSPNFTVLKSGMLAGMNGYSTKWGLYQVGINPKGSEPESGFISGSN